MRLLNPRIYTYLVAIWIGLSLAGLGFGLLVWAKLSRSFEASVESAEFRRSLWEVFSTLQDAETGERGFLLSGDDAFLEPFNRAEADFRGRFEKLAQDAMGQRDLREDVLALKGLAELKLANLRRGVVARRESNWSNAFDRAREEEGRAIMEQIRETIARMDQRPRDLVNATGEGTRRRIRQGLWATLLAGGFGLGAGLMAFYLSRLALRNQRTERALAEQAIRAESAAREKSAFLANMSHEIRTPMNAILGFGDLLATEVPAGSKPHQRVQAIRESAASLLQLINDILDLSKIDAGAVELHLEPTDLREVCGFMQTVFAQQATRKSLQMTYDVDAAVPGALMLDRSRLRQLMVNLIGNAIKFTEQGGVAVRVGWAAEPARAGYGTMRIEIQDTGIGIPPTKQKEIFRAFVQVNPRGDGERQGSGLGLSIVHRLTERMGGTISVASELGQGSTFTLTFPHVAISVRLPESARVTKSERVDFNELEAADLLVVDDDASNRELLAGYFDGTHHRLRFATNGREALQRVREQQPAVVLMDIRMPEMDGRTALSELRKLTGTELLPVIAVTAASMIDDDQVLHGQFAGCLRKPFTRHALFQELAAFLPRRAQPAPAAASPGATAAGAALDGDGSGWPQLVPALRQLQATIWREASESGAINDVKEFAARIRRIGASGNCPLLTDYASALEREADDYAILRMETRLKDFPHLIHTVEFPAASPRPADSRSA